MQRSPERARPRPAQPPQPAFGWLILLALLLLAAFLLRLWSINKESFWADEGWSMLLSSGSSLSAIVGNMVNDQHPPLYFALLHYWTGLVGDSELASRMLSLLWSWLGVALAYRLGADVFRSRGAGLFGALILALADNDIMMAQETRHYTQMTALALLSTIGYFRYLRHGRRGAGLGWFGASVALMYTHYLGAFVLAVQGLHTLIVVRPLRRKLDLIARLALISAAWLPWLLVFLNQSAVRYTRPIIYRNSIPNTPETFVTIRTDLLGGQFALTFGLLLLGLLYVRYRADASGQAVAIGWRPALPTFYLAAWVALPIGVIVAINSRLEILTPRNFLLVTPPIAVLIGHGVMNLDRTARAFVVAVLVFYGLTTVDSYFVKPPWRQVAQDILRYRYDGEPVIMDVWVDDFALRYHLGRDLHTPPADLPLISIPEWLEKYTDQFHVRLLDTVNHYDSVWLVQWSKDEAGLVNLLEGHGFRRTAEQIETHLTTNIIHIWRYDRPPGAAQVPIGTFSTNATPTLALARASAPTQAAPGGDLRVGLWWLVLAAPGKEYSTSVFLLAPDGRLAAQQDGPPLGGRSPMNTWAAGDYRFDAPTIRLPATLPTGTYTLGVKVYFYADPAPLAARTGSNSPNEYNDYLTLGRVQVR